MKKLKRMLLINWYYFEKEIIEFETLTFLTGKNATGKSTIIDALQLVMLGDTSGNYFNKSANDKARRTLAGYLRGELSDDGASGFTYLRDDAFTSYIVLEFYDEERKRSITAGCCFDVHSESDIPHVFFDYYGTIPDTAYTIDDVPMEIALLRRWLHTEHPESSTTITDTGKAFREDLYAKLGGLQAKFADLFRKAVPFNPIADIQKFITEFVFGNEEAVDIHSMQETIESYTKLEEEADRLEARKELLQKIEATYADYQKYTEQAQLHRYIADSAACDIAKQALADKEKRLVELERLQEQQASEARRIKRLCDDANAAYWQAEAEKNNSGLKKMIETLEKTCADLKQQIDQWKADYEHRNHGFTVLTASWCETLRLCMALPQEIPDGFSERSKINLETFRQECDATETVKELARQELKEADLTAIKDSSARIQAVRDGARVLQLDVEQDLRANAGVVQKLNAEKAELQSGRQQYPAEVTQLQQVITQRLQIRSRETVAVRIVADLWDVRDPAWRNAIEGYLNTQRYNLLVSAAQYQTAVRIYDEIKERMHIHGVAIVDIAAVRRMTPVCTPGSLAEEIVTGDEEARLYANYLLGRVMKCTDIAQHNRQEISITQEGMLYQGKAIRRLNPKIWAHPLLGQGARKLRLAQVEDELRTCQQITAALAVWQSGLHRVTDLQQPTLGTTELEEWQLARDGLANIPAAQQKMAETKSALDEIDRAPLEVMEEKVKALKRRAEELNKQYDDATNAAVQSKSECEIYEKRDIPAAKQRLAELQQTIAQNYDATWQEQVAAPRYQSELASHNSLPEVQNNFTRSAQASQTLAERSRSNLRDARSEYNRLYQTGYDVDKADNDDYAQTLQEIRENRLPAYQGKIRDAKEKAIEQFRDEFIGVLYNNIRNAERAIDNLNRALQVPFSEDRYAFKVSPAPEYQRYYEMLTDPLYMDDYNLFSDTFRTKYAQEIDELFRVLTDTRTADVDKRVALYTNYRTYLNFDLTVTSPDGTVQRLSRTMIKKSGGETQTPFYIAVLASFAQIYRMNSDKHASTIRLIVFDEAFSKMDGDRIAQSIRILKQFNFQVLLSAPEDKIGDIAPLVDRNLCVLRKGHKVIVRPFDPRKVMHATV